MTDNSQPDAKLSTNPISTKNIKHKRIIRIIIYLAVLAIVALGMILYSFNSFVYQSVPILAYHRVGEHNNSYTIKPEVFDAQMKYLHDSGYKAISLAKMQELFNSGKPLEHKYIVVTFDDGYADNLHNAVPILKKYGYTATVFVVSGMVQLPQYLTTKEVGQISAEGIEIGTHTDKHLALAEQTPKDINSEMYISKMYLKMLTKKNVEYLAYPFGSVNAAAVEQIKKSGIKGAVTGVDGVNTKDTDPYYWKRVNVLKGKDNVTVFKIRLLRAQFKTWRQKTFSL